MINQLQCLIKACNQQKIPYSFFDDNKNCIVVLTPKGKKMFINSAVSINADTDNNIAQDKYFTYKLLHPVIKMPATTCYVDPFIEKQYSEYVKHREYSSIVDTILKEHNLPCVVKQTRGTHGINVFICRNRAEIGCAVAAILNQHSKVYDYTVLAQEYVKPKQELRLVVLDGQIQFLYEKNIDNARFAGNISPFHWENAFAKLLTDKKIINAYQKLIDPLYQLFPIRLAGLDVIVSTDDQRYLIEVNSRPGFSHFIRDNGEKLVVELYQKILLS